MRVFCVEVTDNRSGGDDTAIALVGYGVLLLLLLLLMMMIIIIIITQQINSVF